MSVYLLLWCIVLAPGTPEICVTKGVFDTYRACYRVSAYDSAMGYGAPGIIQRCPRRDVETLRKP